MYPSFKVAFANKMYVEMLLQIQELENVITSPTFRNTTYTKDP